MKLKRNRFLGKVFFVDGVEEPEIDQDLLDMFGGSAEPEVEPETKPEQNPPELGTKPEEETKPASTESVESQTAEPAVSEPAANSEPPSEPATKPEETTPPDPLEELRKQIETLSAELATAKASASLAKPTESEPPAGDAGQDTSEKDYIGDQDIDEVVARPELFNKVINAAVNDAVEQVTARFEQAFASIPTMVQPAMRQTYAAERAIEHFFDEHKLLGNFRQVVGQVADQLQAENPKDSLADLLPKIAERSYQTLRIDPAAINKVVDNKPQSPALPGAHTNRGNQQPTKDSFSSEFDELYKL
jgi:hypothetical protein